MRLRAGVRVGLPYPSSPLPLLVSPQRPTAALCRSALSLLTNRVCKSPTCPHRTSPPHLFASPSTSVSLGAARAAPLVFTVGEGVSTFRYPRGGAVAVTKLLPLKSYPPPWSYVICSICSPCRQHRSQRDLRLLLPGCQLHYPHGSRERLIPSGPPHGLAQWLRIQLLHLLQCIHTHAELQQIVGLGCSQLTVGLGHSPRQLISVGAALGSVAVGLILHSPLCPIHLCLRAAGAL